MSFKSIKQIGALKIAIKPLASSETHTYLGVLGLVHSRKKSPRLLPLDRSETTAATYMVSSGPMKGVVCSN